jgi:hypothetical protein
MTNTSIADSTARSHIFKYPQHESLNFHSLAHYESCGGFKEMSLLILKNWNIWSPVSGCLGRVSKCDLAQAKYVWALSFQKT